MSQGCIFCGARRMSCDRARPNCTRCQSEGRRCSYQWSLGDSIFGLFPQSANLNDKIRLQLQARSVEEGGFGRVYRTSTSEGLLVAVKVLFENKWSAERALELSVREAYTWSHLKHSNIVPFLGLANYQKICPGAVPQLCLVSPWMAEGCIMDYIDRNPSHARLAFLKDLALAVQYLHTSQSSPIIHGDIRGRNLLIDVDDGVLVARLADFGLTNIMESLEQQGLSTTSTLSMGNLRWMAPERVLPRKYGLDSSRMAKSAMSDIFEMMRTFYEVLSGRQPFDHVARDIDVFTLLHDGTVPERPQGAGSEIDTKLWELMRTTWQAEPPERPPLSDVLEYFGELKEDGSLARPVAQAHLIGPSAWAPFLKELGNYLDINIAFDSTQVHVEAYEAARGMRRFLFPCMQSSDTWFFKSLLNLEAAKSDMDLIEDTQAMMWETLKVAATTFADITWSWSALTRPCGVPLVISTLQHLDLRFHRQRKDDMFELSGTALQDFAPGLKKLYLKGINVVWEISQEWPLERIQLSPAETAFALESYPLWYNLLVSSPRLRSMAFDRELLGGNSPEKHDLASPPERIHLPVLDTLQFSRRSRDEIGLMTSYITAPNLECLYLSAFEDHWMDYPGAAILPDDVSTLAFLVSISGCCSRLQVLFVVNDYGACVPIMGMTSVFPELKIVTAVMLEWDQDREGSTLKYLKVFSTNDQNLSSRFSQVVVPIHRRLERKNKQDLFDRSVSPLQRHYTDSFLGSLATRAVIWYQVVDLKSEEGVDSD